MSIAKGHIIPLNLGIAELGVVESIQLDSYWGKGLYGETWKAVIQNTKIKIVLEIIDVQALKPSEKSSFILSINQKIQAYKKLKSIVKSYALIHLDDQRLGMVHEYVTGEAIAQWAIKNSQAPWKNKSICFHQILTGYQAILAKEPIQGDQLLNHLWVLEDGQIKFMNVGLAKYPIDFSFQNSGDKVSHAAPEVYFNLGEKRRKECSDVFSISCFLFTLIKGQNYWTILNKKEPPFNFMHHEGQLTSSDILSQFFNDFSHPDEGVMAVLRKGTIFDPNHRIASLDGLQKWFKPEDAVQFNNLDIDKSLQEEQIVEEEEKLSFEEEPIKKSNWLKGLLLLSIFAIVGYGLFSFYSKKEPVEPINLKERVAWRKALDKNTIYYYQRFREDFKASEFNTLVNQKIHEINPGNLDLDQLKERRFTGKIEEYNDQNILSLRFKEVEEKEHYIDIVCSINSGALYEEIQGRVDRKTLQITFNTNNNAQLKLEKGQIYFRNGVAFIESIDLDQYWIVE